MARPTVEDLARHARIPGGSVVENSEDLERTLSAAIGLVESMCGPMEPGTAVLSVPLYGRGLAFLPLGVASATVLDGSSQVIAYDVDSSLAAGLLYLTGTYGTYSVAYTRSPECLDALWLATLHIAARQWDVRRGSTSSNRPQDVDEGGTYARGIPPRAMELMAPWTSPVLA